MNSEQLIVKVNSSYTSLRLISYLVEFGPFVGDVCFEFGDVGGDLAESSSVAATA